MLFADYDSGPLTYCYTALRDVRGDAALRTPVWLDPQATMLPGTRRCQEELIYAGLIPGHVAWDYIDANRWVGDQAYRRLQYNRVKDQYAYVLQPDTPVNVAARIASEAPLLTKWFGRLS